MRGKFLFVLVSLLVATPTGTWGASPPDKEPEIHYDALELYTRILNLIQNYYVEDVNQEEVIYGSIDGMLQSLDPHSAFLRPEIYQDLQMDTEGKFGGLGIEITVQEDVLTIVTPLEGTPASQAGLKEGDQIVKIDGEATREMSLNDAVHKMRGKKGSKITLTIVRPGNKKPFDVNLTRDIIKIRSVRHEILEDRYGYIRISSFQERTGGDLKKALIHLQKQGVLGLVLDLRNNPGGLLEAAIDVTDQFLREGVIVSIKSRDREIDKKVAAPDGTEPAYPIIVLINGGSASASEIVAGALQDQGRAILLGTTSFGKGSVQTIYELGQGAALKLTAALYYTPSGRSIQAEGIQPNIVIKKPEDVQTTTLTPTHVREKDLKGHLESDSESKRTRRGRGENDAQNAEEEEETDFQKRAALNYLKSWTVFGQPASPGKEATGGTPPGESP